MNRRRETRLRKLHRAVHAHRQRHPETYKAVTELTLLVVAGWIVEGFKHPVLAVFGKLL